MERKLGIVVLCVLTILCWGGWGMFGRLALDRKTQPMSFFVAQMLVGFLFSAIVFLGCLGTRAQWVWPLHWNIYALLAGTALALGLIFYSIALQKDASSTIVSATALYPAVTILGNFLILGERPTPTQWVGMGLACVSIYLLVFGASVDGHI